MVHIKKVLIQGFKSYREMLDLEPFSDGYNVVVGHNGHGKSSFFDAIKFVLCDFEDLRTADARRRALLHDGAGARAASAAVEVHLDNTDRRFPVERDLVVLRREVLAAASGGGSVDQYTLDGKHVSRQDVMSLLESGGFSRSNPYYIVEQGKVAELTTMKDARRLDLLKEIAGTTVYDERRAESVRILHDTEQRALNAEKLLAQMETQLDTKRREMEELQRYQALDKEHRALLYAFYSKEKVHAENKLERVDEARLQESARAKEYYKTAVDAHDALKGAERELRDVRAQMQQYSDERARLETERADALAEAAQAELQAADEERQRAAQVERLSVLRCEHATVTADASRLADDAERLRPAFVAAVEAERALEEQARDLDRRINELLDRQGRCARFSSKEERDRWLREEIPRLEAELRQERDAEADLRRELQDQTAAVERERSSEAELRALQAAQREEMAACERERRNLKEQRDDLERERKAVRRVEERIGSEIARDKDGLVVAERELQGSMGSATAGGLAAVRRITEELNLPGVHGPIIELIEVSEEFATAVEVAGGGALFYVVVDSDTTATRLLDEMNAQRVQSRVTFVPLNRVEPTAAPSVRSDDVLPLIDNLRFAPMFRPAVAQVFGKTLVCRTLELAASVARAHNMSCITLDGDQVNRRGALTGGFHDSRQSRLGAMATIKACRGRLQNSATEVRKLRAELAVLDQRVTVIGGELSRVEMRIAQLREVHEQLTVQLRAVAKSQRLRALESALEQQQRAADDRAALVAALEEQLASLRSEIGTDLLARLTANERARLDALRTERDSLTARLTAASTSRAEAESARGARVTVANLAARRARDLADEVASVSLQVDAPQGGADYSRRLVRLQELLRDAGARATELDGLSERCQPLEAALVQRLDDLKSEERTQTSRIQEESKTMEKLLNERHLLLQKKDEALKKIRELGSLPADALDQFSALPTRELEARIKLRSRELEKYDVNKKAAEQYVTYMQQHSGLVERRAELAESQRSIEALIQSLDLRKDEAIYRTYKGVAKRFSEVFSELVPGGVGYLAMQTGALEPAGAAAAAAEPGGGRVDHYTGVSVKVSFTSTSLDDAQPMASLSGGQKSLVALALIFAIQRCDPAPFYLFDEIDAALDAPHRESVARLIQAQSRAGDGGAATQFIVTTFKPELVLRADKWYAIAFRNMVSAIESVSRQTALAVLQESDASGPAAMGADPVAAAAAAAVAAATSGGGAGEAALSVPARGSKRRGSGIRAT